MGEGSSPHPRHGGRYFIFVRLTTTCGVTGIGEIYNATFGPDLCAAMAVDDACVDESTVPQLKEKLDALQTYLNELREREEEVKAHPDKQLSETDPDSRLMKQSTVGSLVGYNVQTAVDTNYKLIVAPEVTNSPVDRGQLLPLARLAQQVLGRVELTVLADRGYYKGTDIKSCVDEGMTTLIPKSKTSNNGANGFFPRSAFKYAAQKNEYRCPADQILTYRHGSIE